MPWFNLDIKVIQESKGSQGGQVGYALGFLPIRPGSSPAFGTLP